MNHKPIGVALLLAGVLGAGGLAAAEEKPDLLPIPPRNVILGRLKKEHPRLLASARDFAQLKERIASDPQLKPWREKLQTNGERLLQAPPSQYEIPDGLRLLSTSRRVVDRTYTLALLYRLDGDRRFLDRAWLELNTAAAFTNWNPRHFLDTAEMTHAFAIGYDWLYDAWTAEQRATLRTAMVEKGIQPALGVYTKGNGWWSRARHNWNQVCNGGIGMGALALGDEAPDLCGEFLERSLKSIQLAMAEFAPDGAWAEGPGYWDYATSYNVDFLAALDTALGTDFGLAQMPGFSETGTFPIFMSGPTGTTFSYADAHEGTIRASQMFWLARKFNRPEYSWYQQRVSTGSPQDILWFDPKTPPFRIQSFPLDKHYRGSEVALFRSAWEDRDALFLGVKAGDNKANHSHLDLGTFSLDALGTRWAVDLGSDNYNLPAYFGKQRWNYYRLRAEGHNTLVINPGQKPDQDPKAAAKITRFQSRPERAFALLDLSAAYAAHARKVRRGLAMLDRQQVLVQDEIECDKPAEVWWFMHTKTKVTLSADGATATLSDGKKQLRVQILQPRAAVFQVMDAVPLAETPHPEKQGENKGVRKLAIQLKDVSETRLAVLMTPVTDEKAMPSSPKVTPLRDW